MKGLALIVVLVGVSSVHCRLERTKLVNGGIYRLESQHDGAFLSAFGNGKVGTKQATGGGDQGQRWTFTQNADSSWTMTPVIPDINIVSEQTWKAVAVSHGKTVLQSLSTQKCLLNSRSEATLIEGTCDKDDPRQRWNIQTAAPAA